MEMEYEDPELKRILERKYLELIRELKKPKFGKPIELNEENFEEEIKKVEHAVIDFWASWCMPCKIMAPIIEELSKEYPNIMFGKVNVDENPNLSSRYFIQAIPTFIFFSKGEIVERITGARSKIEFKKILHSVFKI